MSNPIPSDETHQLPLPLARHVDEVCYQFEAAWKAVAQGAEPPRVEAYLGEIAEPVRTVLLGELLKIEEHHRQRRTSQQKVESNSSMAQFLDALHKSALLDPSQARTLNQASVGQHPEVLAASLIGRGWLTTYQVSRLLAGRGNELVLGNYRLLEPLGEGGMGQVFKARHTLMNRIVAIKLIRNDFVDDPVAVQRFHIEIQAAAQLHHPHVVVAHDAEEANGRHFLVMEYCQGVTLRQFVEQSGPLSTESACEYIRQAALGLQHANERGLVHRDIKPANLMLMGETVKILDFGLARLRLGDTKPTSATKEGTLLGTPDYMAPEQAEGRSDIRSDLYSLGCTFYFLLAGRPPFAGGGLLETCLRHRTEEPESLAIRRPDVPIGVQQIVRRLMAKKPEDRYQTPAELAEVLGPFARINPAAQTLHRIEGRVATQPEMTELPRELTPTPAPHRARSARLRWSVIGIGLALVGVACAVGLLVSWNRRDPEAPKERQPVGWRSVRELPIPKGQVAAYCLAFSPDSRELAAAYGNNEDASPLQPGLIHVWEVKGWRTTMKEEAGPGPGTCVAFSPDGKRMAWGMASWNHTPVGQVTLWATEDRRAVNKWEGHPKGVLALAFQPGGDLLASSGLEGNVHLWDAVWGANRGPLKTGKSPTGALAFSPDGELLASGSDDGSVDLWEVKTRRNLGPLANATGKPVRGLGFTADGRTVLAVTKKGQGKTADLLAWDWETRHPAPIISLDETEGYCMAMAPNRITFITGFQNKTATLFASKTRQTLQTLPSTQPVFCVAFSPDGKLLATSGGYGGAVQIWEPAE